MKKQDVVKLTLDLVNIRSDSLKDGEKEVSKYINEYLQDIGINSEMIEFERGRCNVVATVGEGEGLLLNGHMDTVPIGDLSQWKYRPEGKIYSGKVFGRGTSDMKGGIAAILSALSGAKISKPKRKLVFTFVADEEVGCSGSTWLLKNRKKMFSGVKYGLIAEPTDLMIETAQKGIMEIELTTKGKGAHGSRPWLGKNAILDMSKAMQRLEKLSNNFKVTDDVLGKGSMNIGKIEGGTATNVVPDYCTISVDRRLVPGESADIAIAQIKNALSPLKIDYKIKLNLARKPYKISRDSYIVKLLLSITKGEFTFGTGYTEAELYKSLANIDSVVYGPGSKQKIHQSDEFVSIANLTKGRAYFLEIMNRWCSGK